MPRYDYACPVEGCPVRKLNVYVPTWRASEHVLEATCPEHYGWLVKLPSAPNVRITGYSAKNGYSRS